MCTFHNTHAAILMESSLSQSAQTCFILFWNIHTRLSVCMSETRLSLLAKVNWHVIELLPQGSTENEKVNRKKNMYEEASVKMQPKCGAVQVEVDADWASVCVYHHFIFQTPNGEQWKMISGFCHFDALRNNAQYVASERTRYLFYVFTDFFFF